MEKIWLKQYTPGVPDTINPDAFDSLVHLFEKYAVEFSQRPVFTSYGISLTYQEMRSHVDHFAAFLQQHLRLQKGARVAMMLPNILQYPVAIFGALKAGCVVVNINPLYTAPELVKQLNDAQAETIIVMENFADHLEAALPKTQTKHVIIAKIGDLLGIVKGNFLNFAVRYLKGKVPDYQLRDAIFFNKALSIGKTLQFQPVALRNSDMAFLQYTGGTTGHSKGAVLTHRNIIANILQCVSWIRGVKPIRYGVLVGALPMYHIFSLTVCCMCPIPMGASTILIPNPRDIRSFVHAIRRAKISMMVGLNTLFNGLLHEKTFEKVDFSHLKLTISGGMAMQKAVAERWHKVTGIPILEGYGLTESSPVLTLCPVNITHFTGSIGVPVPSTEIVIRDDESSDLPIGQLGEIWARGPQVMRGYWHHEEETCEALDENGWLRTGDIGYMDERGFVYIVDRKKDMVLVSGFNVYPNEVEDVLAMHPGIKAVAVIGVPSEKTGEALKAFVVRENIDITEAVLQDFCRQSLTSYKVPKLFEFRDALPMSNVGKVLRKELRKEEKT